MDTGVIFIVDMRYGGGNRLTSVGAGTKDTLVILDGGFQAFVVLRERVCDIFVGFFVSVVAIANGTGSNLVLAGSKCGDGNRHDHNHGENQRENFLNIFLLYKIC